jgi:endonuclease YncB( thermonuclease family)
MPSPFSQEERRHHRFLGETVTLGATLVVMDTSTSGEQKRNRNGRVVIDGMNLNQGLVKQGWCWWYRKYVPGDTVLEGLEKNAREAKKGFWADPQPVPSWE